MILLFSIFVKFYSKQPYNEGHNVPAYSHYVPRYGYGHGYEAPSCGLSKYGYGAPSYGYGHPSPFGASCYNARVPYGFPKGYGSYGKYEAPAYEHPSY